MAINLWKTCEEVPILPQFFWRFSDLRLSLVKNCKVYEKIPKAAVLTVIA
jgi:hypothetical protein